MQIIWTILLVNETDQEQFIYQQTFTKQFTNNNLCTIRNLNKTGQS